MSKIEIQRQGTQLFSLIGKFLGSMAILLLCIMVVVICLDVIGRYFFAAPLLGAHEMITLAMGVMIYLGMPLVTASGEHLVVDLMGGILGSRAKRIQRIVVNAIGALTFLLFSYLLLLNGIGLAEDLMTTEDLEIELAPIAYLMAALCFLTILVFLNRMFRNPTGREPDHSAQAEPRNHQK